VVYLPNIIIMIKLNELLKDLTAEMWKIKNNTNQIEMQELLDFYKTYHSYANLATDILNAKILSHCKEGSSHMEKLIIETFQNINGYKYDRLLIDSLLELDNELSFEYLRNILSFEDINNKSKFIDDFNHHPLFEKVMALIENNDNKRLNLPEKVG